MALESSNSFVASHIVVNATHNGLTTYCETKTMGRLFLTDDVTVDAAALTAGEIVDDLIHAFI